LTNRASIPNDIVVDGCECESGTKLYESLLIENTVLYCTIFMDAI